MEGGARRREWTMEVCRRQNVRSRPLTSKQQLSPAPGAMIPRISLPYQSGMGLELCSVPVPDPPAQLVEIRRIGGTLEPAILVLPEMELHIFIATHHLRAT